MEQDFVFTHGQKTGRTTTINFPLESGIGFSGKFLNHKGKPEKTNLTIVQGNFENVIMRETNTQGIFWETGFQFYDSLEFSFQCKNAKGKPYGKVEVLKREIPPMDFKEGGHHLKVIAREKSHPIVSGYNSPNDVKVLEEVSVTAKRIQGSDFVDQRYGPPTRIVKGDKLVGADMLSALLTTIPGLKINYTSDIPPRQLTMGHNVAMGGIKKPAAEPLVYVNDVFRGGGLVYQGGTGAVSALEIINPANVDHVEVITQLNNSRIVMEGGAGLIAIYTKPGTEDRKGFSAVKIPGFNRPKEFISPDYGDITTDLSRPDFRSTIYWNPELRTDATTGEAIVSFFAADLPGRYRVVIEGITDEGAPVRSEQFIEVADH